MRAREQIFQSKIRGRGCNAREPRVQLGLLLFEMLMEILRERYPAGDRSTKVAELLFIYLQPNLVLTPSRTIHSPPSTHFMLTPTERTALANWLYLFMALSALCLPTTLHPARSIGKTVRLPNPKSG